MVNTVSRALDPGDFNLENLPILTSGEVPPATLSVVIDGASLIALGAAGFSRRGKLDHDRDLSLRERGAHFGHFPRLRNPKNLAIEVGVFHPDKIRE